jgi:hypothetical protein
MDAYEKWLKEDGKRIKRVYDARRAEIARQKEWEKRQWESHKQEQREKAERREREKVELERRLSEIKRRLKDQSIERGVDKALLEPFSPRDEKGMDEEKK